MIERQPFNPVALFMRFAAAVTALFLLAFTLATGFIFVRQVRHDLRVAQAYQHAPCTYVDPSEWPKGSRSPRDTLLVRYEREGKQQEAWVDRNRYYFEVEYPPVLPKDGHLAETQSPQWNCWVDPDAPDEAVVGRTPWTSYLFVLIPLVCAAGLIFAIRVVIYGPGKLAE